MLFRHNVRFRHLGLTNCIGTVEPMSQSVPDINEVDVWRVIRRDFGADEVEAIYNVLSQYSSPLWAWGKDKSREPHFGKMYNEHQVYLAILKLANGMRDKLEHQLQVANIDPRDVIGFAEYPRFTRIGFVGAEKLDAEAQRLIDDDFPDYMGWLTAK